MLPGPAAPRTGVGEEQQPHQRDAPGLRRPRATRALALLNAPLFERRRHARDIVQGAASGRAQCRCTNNQGRRGAAAAPEWRIWPISSPGAPSPNTLNGNTADLSCSSTIDHSLYPLRRGPPPRLLLLLIPSVRDYYETRSGRTGYLLTRISYSKLFYSQSMASSTCVQLVTLILMNLTF